MDKLSAIIVFGLGGFFVLGYGALLVELAAR